jgi:P27 family predicted phage terminase small subunit
LITSVDVTTFARYCRNFARWLKMQRTLDDNTETYRVETASGVVHRARPEFLIADRLERQLMSAEDRFGLNPAERQRIMAARAQTGVSGDLFAANVVREERENPMESPTHGPSGQGPIGLLN